MKNDPIKVKSYTMTRIRKDSYNIRLCCVGVLGGGRDQNCQRDESSSLLQYTNISVMMKGHMHYKTIYNTQKTTSYVSKCQAQPIIGNVCYLQTCNSQYTPHYIFGSVADIREQWLFALINQSLTVYLAIQHGQTICGNYTRIVSASKSCCFHAV